MVHSRTATLRASRRKAPLALLVLAGALTLAPISAWAHAILIKSSPASGSEIPAGTITFDLRYNSRLDQKRSKLTLIRADRSTSTLPIADGGPVDGLSASATLVPGKYTLRWQVLAVDGHITRGDVPFAVK